ncbi:putative ribonuclease H-like domain-containing protein [Tanacetum coccineum]
MMVQAQEEVGKEPIADEGANEENIPTHSNDPLLNGEDRLKLEELMTLCTNLQNRVLDLEHTKTTQALEIAILKRKVKKHEKKQRSRTHKLKTLYKVGLSAKVISSEDEGLGKEDVSKQGKRIANIDVVKDITLDITYFDIDPDMFRVHDLDGDEVFVETKELVVNAATTTKLKSAKPKAVTTTATITTTIVTRPKAKGLVIQEHEQALTPIVSSLQSSHVKDKGQFDEEARIIREKEEANATLIAQWNDIQDKKRRKFFSAKRAEEKRNRPPTKAQQRSIMCTYLKNMAGWKNKDLKNKSFAKVQELFDKAMKRGNIFVDMDIELAAGSEVRAEGSETRADVIEESSSKRAGNELEQERIKKQKMDKDKEIVELQSMMVVIPDEEEVGVDAIPLATKPLIIVDCKIIKEGKIGYFQIIRADGSSKRLEEGYERVLWGDLKTMFEHHIEDTVWSNLQGQKVLVWKIFDSYGVHFLRVQSMHIFILVEKRYLLTPATITNMLNKKLQADHLNEIYYKEIDRGYVAFGGNPKGGKIIRKGTIKTGNLDFENVYFVSELKFNLFSVSQMCDKKNSVLFNDTECIVLSPNFKLIDESQVLLRVLRKNNMYSVDLKNIFPKEGLTCLFAKATSDESKLWHRRLGHLNFKTMNKLVEGNLVRGLPSKLFENNQTCVACKRESSIEPLDETSGILMSFITGIENLVDHKVKVARTMLADSKLPTTFWAEAVNTACYVQNRVLVVKPHNKTPYKLFHGRTPTLSFIRPFGCPVTILNTIDHLGKFNGKADEGFFIGYSLNSKAFRVFNSRTRIVEENLHIRFSENTPNFLGSGPDWQFDIDALTRTMLIYHFPKIQRVLKMIDLNLQVMMERRLMKIQEKIVNLLMKKRNIMLTALTMLMLLAQMKLMLLVEKTSIELPVDPDMPELKDYSIFKDDEDVGAEADMNNLDTTIQVSPIPTTRIHKDHHLDQVIRDFQSATQTRRMSNNLEEHGFEEPKKVIYALKDPSWIEAMQEELLQFKLQKVWTLVDLPNGKRAIGTKWVFGNKKDEMGIVIRNKARLIEEDIYVCQPPRFEDPDFLHRVYKVKKALYELHQAPKAWYETLLTYLLDNEFQRGKIDKTLFIKRYKGDILLVQVYVDDIIFGSTKKELCNAFKKLMHEKFQISSMGELTFFLGLQVQQKKDGIFISQDKYVGEIRKKFGFTEVKTTSTPMETQKPLLKDEDGEEVDVHMYRSMIGSLMYLTSSRPDIMFAVCACARYQVNPKVSHLYVVKRIFRYLKGQPKLGLWYPKYSHFDLVTYTDSDYARASLDRKSTTGVNAARHNLLLLVKVNAARHNLLFLVKVNAAKHNLLLLVKVNAAKLNLLLLAKTINREVQLQALVNGNKVIITESTMRRDLQLEDVDGVDCLTNATIFKQLTLMGSKTTAWNEFSSTMASAIIYNVADKAVYEELDDSLEMAATTATSLNADDRGNINKTQSKATPNEPSSPETSLSGGPRHQETIGDTITQTRSENVSKLSNDPLLVRGNEISSLKRRVKKLERRNRSKTHKLKRLYKVSLSRRVESSKDEGLGEEDASKQGRIVDIDADKDIYLVNVQIDEDIFGVNDLDGDEVIVENVDVVKTAKETRSVVEDTIVIEKAQLVNAAKETINATTTTKTVITDVEITLAQALADLKSAKPKVDKVVIQEPEQGTTTPTTAATTITAASTRPRAKGLDKGKGKIVELEPVKKLSKKDQLSLNKELAFKLQAREEEERLAKEKAQEVKEANIAWDDVQAKIEADY